MNLPFKRIPQPLVCLAVMICNWQPALAFDHTTDSIRNLLNLQKTDTGKVVVMNDFAESQIDKKTDYSIQLAEEAFQLANKIHFYQGIGRSYNILSWANYRKGDYTKAFELGLKGLRLNDSIQNLPQLAIAYRNLASVYNAQSSFKLALEYFQKDLELHTKLKDAKGIGRALNNISYTYFKEGQLNNAKTYIHLALTHNKYLGDDYLIAFAYRNFGDVFDAQKRYDSALMYYNQSIKHASIIENKFLLQSSLFRKGRIYYAIGRYPEAIKTLKESVRISTDLGSKSGMSQSYKQLALTLEKIGDFKGAYLAQYAYTSISDSLYQERNRSKLIQLQTNFETEKKQAEIEVLNREKQLRETALKNQLMVSILLGILVLLITVILLITWRRNEFKKKTNTLLREQKKTLEDTSILKDKIFSIISHDLRSPIASLSAVLPLLDRNSLDEEVFDTIKKNLAKQLNALNFTIDNLLIWARAQWKGSTPPEKTSFKLSTITDHTIGLLLPMAEQKKIQLSCSINDQIIVWADRQQIDIIIRNLVLNAIKFTHEKGIVEIGATDLGDTVEITVTDSGIGMTESQQSKLFELRTHFTTQGTQKEKGTGLGLLICQDFAQLNGSKLMLKSEPGEGTIVSFTLPKIPDEQKA